VDSVTNYFHNTGKYLHRQLIIIIQVNKFPGFMTLQGLSRCP